jgi:hypothetical protein
LFKEELRGNAMVSIASKTYIWHEGDFIKEGMNKETGEREAIYHKTKCSAMGLQKSSNKTILNP